MSSYWEDFHSMSDKHDFTCLTQIQLHDLTYNILTRSVSGNFLLTQVNGDIILWTFQHTQNKIDMKSFSDHWLKISFDHKFDIQPNTFFYIDERNFDANLQVNIFIISDQPHNSYTKIEIAWENTNEIEEIRIIQKLKINAGIMLQIDWIRNEREIQLRAIQEMIWRREISLEKPAHFLCVSNTTKQNMELEKKIHFQRSTPEVTNNDSELCLLKLLMIEQDWQHWNINDEICSLYTMTSGFQNWTGERSYRDQLEHWMQGFKSEANTSFFFLFSYTHPFHLPILQWFQRGAQPNFFSQDSSILDNSVFASQSFEWYSKNRHKLLLYGKQKFQNLNKGISIKSFRTHLEMDFHQSCSKSFHLHFQYTLKQLNLIQDYLIHEDSRFRLSLCPLNTDSNKLKLEIQDLFHTFRNTLQVYMQYAEYIEMFISLLYSLRECRKNMFQDIKKDIFSHIQQKTDILRRDDVLVNEIQKILSAVFSTNYEKLWALTNTRLQSVLSPHVFSAFQDFIAAGHSVYPSVSATTNFISNF